MLIKDIGIDEGQVPHPDAGKHLGGMSAQPAAADEGDTGVVQLQLLPDIDRIPIAGIAQRQNARFECLPLDVPKGEIVLRCNRLLSSQRQEPIVRFFQNYGSYVIQRLLLVDSCL